MTSLLPQLVVDFPIVSYSKTFVGRGEEECKTGWGSPTSNKYCPAKDSKIHSFSDIRTESQYTYFDKIQSRSRSTSRIELFKSPLTPIKSPCSLVEKLSFSLSKNGKSSPVLESIPSAVIKRKKERKRSLSPARLEKHQKRQRELAEERMDANRKFQLPQMIVYIESKHKI
jgi:hypothetical protein